MNKSILIAAVSSLLLAACAVQPAFVDVPPVRSVAPYQASRNADQFLQQDVLWGGMVLEVTNFEHYSEVEILAYPLDDKQRPLLEAADKGRFIALLSGFADPASLPRGRFVSVIGTITGDRVGPLRNDTYTWPEVDVKQLHLWPRDFRQPKSRVSFGVGVGVGR